MKAFQILAPLILGLNTNLLFAQTNTIQFEGRVAVTTCELKIDGQLGNAHINLPTVNIARFDKDNTTVAVTDFELNLTNCNLGTKTAFVAIKARESFKTDIYDYNKEYANFDLANMDKSSQAAQGIGLRWQSYNSTGATEYNIEDTPEGKVAVMSKHTSPGGMTQKALVYYTRIVERDKVKPGKVMTIVDYNVYYK